MKERVVGIVSDSSVILYRVDHDLRKAGYTSFDLGGRTNEGVREVPEMPEKKSLLVVVAVANPGPDWARMETQKAIEALRNGAELVVVVGTGSPERAQKGDLDERDPDWLEELVRTKEPMARLVGDRPDITEALVRTVNAAAKGRSNFVVAGLLGMLEQFQKSRRRGFDGRGEKSI